MRRIVSLWFPRFAVERFIRGRKKAAKSPPPKGLPFALVEKNARGLRLFAVNGMAQSFGLYRGQKLADARAQVPDLLSEPHEPEQDTASLLGLTSWMERYSPWAAPDAPDGILLDVTGIPHLFGGEAAMLADIQTKLGGYGFTARPAMARTIGAAWGLARFHSSPGPDEPLDALPVEALRIDGASVQTLRRLGLKTIGSLVSIPRASLARRFRGETIAENVLIRLDEALGHRDEPLSPNNPPSSFMAHRALMEPVTTSDGLDAVLAGLVASLGRDLERRSQGATRLILKLFRTDGTRASLPVGLSAPSYDAQHLLRLIQPKLGSVDAAFGIDAMTLEARETGAVVKRQYVFMQEDASAGLGQLNDRVLNRHETFLGSLHPVESHIPEQAETVLPRPHRVLESQGTFSAEPIRVRLDRPLLIFEWPEPVTVLAAVPDGPPMRFTWRRVTRRVVRSQGPERIAPEWWRLEQGQRPRDYYMIEDEKGRRYWLYREGLYGETGEAQPAWFVHGLG